MRIVLGFLIAILWIIMGQIAHAQISSPQDVPNLAFWVDAQDVNGSGIQPANGSVVTSWVDKSGGGNNLTTAAGTVTFEATGFDGVNPGLRFPLIARMAGNNPFPGNTHSDMTIFFVNSNVTLTRNFAVSLNGTTTSASGRVSFHAPWINNRAFFDVNGTTPPHRLNGLNPNTNFTNTTLYTGLNEINNVDGDRQILRVDGQLIESDLTGHNANVSGGIHLGDLPNNREFNGRFAEVLIYDRALTKFEIQAVECWLLTKWNPTDAPLVCNANISAEKTVSPWNLPGSNGYALPGNDVIYTIEVTHMSGAHVDEDSLFLVDAIPDEVIFYNGDIDDAGPELNPVQFVDNASGLTFNYATDVGFSDATAKPADFSECDYVPVSGYDSDVTHICFLPKGVFSAGSPSPSFELSFRARIR